MVKRRPQSVSLKTPSIGQRRRDAAKRPASNLRKCTGGEIIQSDATRRTTQRVSAATTPPRRRLTYSKRFGQKSASCQRSKASKDTPCSRRKDARSSQPSKRPSAFGPLPSARRLSATVKRPEPTGIDGKMRGALWIEATRNKCDGSDERERTSSAYSKVETASAPESGCNQATTTTNDATTVKRPAPEPSQAKPSPVCASKPAHHTRDDGAGGTS